MKKVLLCLVFLTAALFATAQDIYVKVDYPSVVNAGQSFPVTYSVNAGGGELAVPTFRGFIKLMGPQTSYSSSTEIINGKVTTSTTNSYTYYLQANTEGKFDIGPAIFTYKNNTYNSDSIHIEVVAGTGGNQAAGGGSGTGSGTERVESRGNDIFLNLSLSKKEVYLGDYIVATVKLYTRVNLAGINEVKYPSFNNFLRSDIETPPLTSLKQENVNGTIYGTGIVQQFLLFPQVSGEITIDPVQISVLVQQKTGQSDPFFGDFFNSVQTVPRAIASQSQKVRVKSLPGTQPSDYSGVVGKLEMKASLEKDSVNVNDAVSFKITLAGNGNLKIAAAPAVKLPPDIEVYDPKISDDLRNTTNGTSGQKTFEYLMIPRHYGEFKVPPVTYSYFNTASGRYEQLKTPEFSFYARKSGDQTTGITVYGGISKEDVKYMGKDIRFIRSSPGVLRRADNVIVSRRTFYSLYILAISVFFLVLFLRREHIRRNSDLSAVRNRKAAKIAGKRLHNASVCLKSEEIDRFYEEILKALWGYLSDKLDIPVSELTRNNALSALSSAGIGEDVVSELNHILDTCEYARFAPSRSETEADTIFEGASHFIKSVENAIG